MGEECFLTRFKQNPSCCLHSSEQADSRLTPCVRMSWEKEITVPGWTEDIAVVKKQEQGELKKVRDCIEEENHPELVGAGVSLCQLSPGGPAYPKSPAQTHLPALLSLQQGTTHQATAAATFQACCIV